MKALSRKSSQKYNIPELRQSGFRNKNRLTKWLESFEPLKIQQKELYIENQQPQNTRYASTLAKSSFIPKEESNLSVF